MNRLVNSLIKLMPSSPVYAHCDIPCGIYDPNRAQMAAHTILRMIRLNKALKKEDARDEKEFIHTLARFAAVQDEHAEILKHEVRILWGDYFKEEHLKDYPNLHGLIFKILKLASKARQEVDESVAMELLSAVLELAEIFYKTKGLQPVRVKSPYPTEEELVLYK